MRRRHGPRGHAPSRPFVPVDALCPSLAALLAVRQTVGLRNPGHTLAKLLAPQPRWLRVVSHTHLEYATLLQQFLVHTGANEMLLRGTESEAVAGARRCPQLQVLSTAKRAAS
jgi:anthranilate phosphoribosyltransferase